MRKTSHITSFLKDHIKGQLSKVTAEYIALPNGDTAVNINFGKNTESATLPKDSTPIQQFQLVAEAADALLNV
jgi:hypothetical protein